MKHNKDQILKAYRRFCDSQWPEDDNCVDDPSPWCKNCDFFKICEKHPFLEVMSDSVYEEMERILEDYDFLDMKFEDKYKQYIYDGFLNYRCETDCERCIVKRQCDTRSSSWTSEDFKFLERILLQTGGIDPKYLKVLEDDEKSKNQDLTANESCTDNTAPIPDHLKMLDGNVNATAKSYEMVNAPTHYNGTDCIETMEKLFGTDAVKHFCILNAYKYLYRAGKKPGVDAEQDRAKAQWYLDYATKLVHKDSTNEYF